MSEEVTSRIRERRLELNMTQSELAKTANLSTAAISQFESGSRKPSFKTIVSLCEAMEVTTDYLLGKNDRTYETLMVDPVMGPMLRGLMGFEENSKTYLYELYKFLDVQDGDLVEKGLEDILEKGLENLAEKGAEDVE